MKKEYLFNIKYVDAWDNCTYERVQDTLERVMLFTGYYNNLSDFEVYIRNYNNQLVARNIYGHGWQLKVNGKWVKK